MTGCDAADEPSGAVGGARYFDGVTMVWQEARRQAAALRRQFGTSSPYAICSSLGIEVAEVRLPAGVSGLIVKERGEDARIFVDADNVEGRRRFTCAHELGHFVDRVNVAGDDDFSFRDERSTRYDLHEFFADEFAGELLMPGREFVSRYKESPSVTALAAQFGVTAKAVEKRIVRLRKNPPEHD